MRRTTIEYQPALDGVRAVAVAAVLLFHAGLGWMSGGYLGVSVFFTLSGFLITSLLLTEHAATGSVDARAFYTRRARRLLPASLVCIAAVCLLAWAGAFSGVTRMRRDVLGALLQVFNWVKLGSGESYADLNAAQAGLRRPLDHYWSLAIEEQFYWIWPLMFLGIVWWCTHRHVTPLHVVGVLVAISAVAAPLIARIWGPNAAYWATPARASEILFGAFVACLVAVRPVAARAAALAPIGLGLLAVGFVVFPDGHGPAYQGALPLVGAVSALTIYGLQAAGPARSVLSLKPLVALGKVSYGVYLYHWPVYVLIDRQGWDLPLAVELTLKWGITGAIATASYFLVERPVRRNAWFVPRRTLIGALVGTALVASMVILVPGVTKYYGVDSTDAEAVSIDTGSVAPLVPATTAPAPDTVPDTVAVATTSTIPATTTSVAVVPPRPVRIVIVGDSTAEATGAGVVAWAALHPELAQVEVAAGPGCGLMLGGYQDLTFGPRDVTATCGEYVSRAVPAKVAELHPDVVMVMTTVWDVLDRQLTKDGPTLSPTDPEMEAAMFASLSEFTDTMLTLVPRVVWIDEPVPLPSIAGGEDQQAQPARHDVLHRVIAEIAGTRPGVRVIDLAGWVKSTDLEGNFDARPDSVHWTPAASERIATEFLGQALLRAALS